MSSEYVVECVFQDDYFIITEGVDPKSWLAWEIEGVGEDWMIRRALDVDDTIAESWEIAMKAGLSPGQTFTVRFFDFESYGPDHNNEYDTESSCELVNVEPRTAAEHLATWESRLAEWLPPFVAPTVTTQAVPATRWRDTCGRCGKRRMVEEFCGDQSCRECLPAAQHDAAGVALEPYY